MSHPNALRHGFAWKPETLAPFIPAFRKDIMGGYADGESLYQSETWLSEKTRAAQSANTTDRDDDGLRSIAALAAARCRQLSPTPGRLSKHAVGYVKSKGFALPKVSKDTPRIDGLDPVIEGIRSRITQEKWWLRRFRTQQAQAQELQASRLGLVNADRQVYISNHSLSRALVRAEISREFIESRDLVNADTGEVMPLEDAVNAGMANPNNRRNEMMMRIADGEAYFAAAGRIALFLTLTTPSKYHPFTRKGGYRKADKMGVNHKIGGTVIPNPKFQAVVDWKRGRGKSATTEERVNTPKLAHEWLSVSWARLRAGLKKSAIACDFMRVTEPHHDGCTHWHCIAFVEESQVKEFTNMLWAKWLREDAGEPGATTYRVDIVKIDRNKGKAASYIAKYVSKNIDGESVATDFESGLDAAESSVRVQAWRTTHVIRAFQFSRGFGQVGIWRELRRVKEAQTGIMELARVAADHSDYRAFMIIQSRTPLSVAKRDNAKPNAYGEITSRVVGVGYAPDDVSVITHNGAWAIVRRVVEADTTWAVADDEIQARHPLSPLGVLKNNCRSAVEPEADGENSGCGMPESDVPEWDEVPEMDVTTWADAPEWADVPEWAA